MGIGNRRVGKLLPTPADPGSTLCITIQIPNAAEYIAAFFGQLDILGMWYTWDHPSDGTQCDDCEIAAQLWRTAVYEARRALECNDMSCSDVVACLTDSPDMINAIVSLLISNETYTAYLYQLIPDVAKPGNNIYPPIPARTETDAVCNAATYCVAQLRALCVSVYDNLETLTPEEAFASILGLFGWRSGPLYQLIGLLETNDRTAFLASFDAAANDLICEIIDAHFNQTPVLNWITETYPSPSVLGDALTVAVQSAEDHGKWALWIAVGSLMTTATCVCATCQDYGLDTSTWNGGEGAASGITVTNGVAYHVDVSGTYTYGGVGSVTADGHVGDFTPGTVEPTINDLRLIAKIGTGGAWFAMGVSADFTADADGELQLIVNDVNASINFADNAGTLAITVCNT